MYFLIIGILIIGLLIIFYNPRQHIYENLNLNERSLKAYLGSINEDTGYKEGSSNSMGEICNNNNKDGYSWNYNITKDNKVLDKSICVPTIYTDPTAFIPCSSEKPGIPDNIDCSDLKDKKCEDEIKKLINFAPAGDEQQYVYICKNNKCPCMNKYGKDYDGPAGNKYKCNIGGCKGTRYKCCPNSTTAKKDEAGSNCKNWKCEKKNCIKLLNSTGDFKTKKECQDNCGKSWKCEKKKCIKLLNSTGKYKTEKDCQDNCSLNGISGVSGGYPGNLSWTKCIEAPHPNLANDKKINIFNTICNSEYQSSTYDSLDARGCKIGYTRVGCSLNSPDELT
jgi:hypothetical protein